jgi:hypothetical protein
MSRRKRSKVEEVVEKPVEKPEASTAAPPTQLPAPPERTQYVIKEATWDEFERFTPTSQQRERPKSPIREAYEAAKSGKVIKIEGLTPAQVRAILGLVSQWNYREKQTTGREPVRAKYDVKAGVVYLAPAEKPAEKQQ